MASAELPPEPLPGRAAATADEVLSDALAVTAGLDVDVITGNMLPTFSAGTVEVEATAAVGLGAAIGTPTGIDGSAAAAGDAAGRDGTDGGGWGAALVGADVEWAVTDTTPVACALVDGFVAAPAEAVRLTHAAPLDGVAIPALRVNKDGVVSVPSDPSWHESVPSPLGQKPVNVTLPADAASVTDTSGTAPFSAWTCTVKRATWPRSTLPLDGWTLTHSITGGALGDTEADAVGDDVGVTGSGSHCEPPLEVPAIAM
jgi:hypothetical protein